jgi:HupE / UreJ protein
MPLVLRFLPCAKLASVARRVIASIAAALLLTIAPGGVAHDIPNDVKVQAFLKPAGTQLQLLVRVPLAAMNEVDFPKRGPGYLDLAHADAALRNAATLWVADNVEIYEGDIRLAYPRIADIRVSLPSDRSFGSFESALAHVTGPRLPDDMDLYWNQQLLDVLFVYPIASERSAFSIHPRLARLGLRVLTTLQFLPPTGDARALEFHGDPGLVRLDPSWHQAALRFVELGFFHILDGTDHLLFLLCLVIPFRRLGALVLLVTSFTVAHSITLIASAFGYAPDALWFPPLVETLIAMSIVYMALENIAGSNLQRRWMITFVFGLVHGFGFSFVLRETLQFAGPHLLTALLAFNVGVELGQLLVIVLLVPALNLLFRLVPERIGTIILSALVAHTAWHWMLERGEQLRQFPWPALDAASLASAMRWLMAILSLGLLLALVNACLRRMRWLPADNKSPVESRGD